MRVTVVKRILQKTKSLYGTNISTLKKKVKGYAQGKSIYFEQKKRPIRKGFRKDDETIQKRESWISPASLDVFFIFL
jgi:hypothetical protein